ncbi:DUF1351 domain-containing protein [Candidatus Clostridium helianthi]|uniref:DUF1351 domain-containing protein n=1 Tax=Candidatus Clostridium helianthi TaxID=3381660 RepID=A0ABW8SC34_9CLOT
MKDLEVIKELPIIKTNFKDVKVSLKETIAKYKGIVVTEEGLQDCKATQKELAGLRNKIDDFRKTVKKDMEVPIKEFEGQCKELMGLISDAEQPIKEGITIFDNKRREEKRNKALELIQESIQAYQLNGKYSSNLTVLDKYLNLSASAKSVKEDIAQRAASLAKEQQDELKLKEIEKSTILATIESANANIKSKLKFEDFDRYINMNYPLDRIIKEINIRAETIRKAENPPEPPNEEIKPMDKVNGQKVIHTDPKPAQKQAKEVETLYFYELRVIANGENMLKLKKLVQSEGFKYETLNKGVVKK